MAVAGLIFWWVYKDFDFIEFLQRFSDVNLKFIYLSIVFGIFSYIFRAFRWALLFEALDIRISTFRSLVALMIGYFANLLVPRMGEISRCGVLKKTDNVEFTTSLGTVVAERTIDVFCLFAVILIGLGVEFRILSQALFSNFGEKISSLFDNRILIAVLIVVFLLLSAVGFILFRKYRHRFYRNPLLIKFRSLFRSLLDGFLSVRKLKRPLLFWISTLLIWMMYFLMTYVVFFSFEPTQNLGIKAGILVLILGGLGMATPVQGGVGPFHLFVSSVLLLYGISEKNAEFFALILHGSQFVLILVSGGMSFFVSLVLPKRNVKNAE